MAKPQLEPGEYVRRLELYRARRSQWDSHWREVAEVVWPAADAFQGSRRNLYGGGEKRTERVFDATAGLAADKFGAIVSSLLIPKSQRWHRLRTTNEDLNKDSSVRAWFDEVEQILFAMRASPRAAYYEQAQQLFKSEGVFGNGCLYIDARKGGGVRYRNTHIGELYIAVDHEGRVDTVYRVFQLSAHQAVQRWGDDAGKQAIDANKKDPTQELEFLHVVHPRKDVDPERLGPEAMAWESVYVHCADRHVTEAGGFAQMPYLYARWSVSPFEVYGRSPAMAVLPNIKVLNQISKTDLRVRHLSVDPMLLLTQEGVLGVGGKYPQFVPGGQLRGGMSDQGRPLVAALQTGAQPSEALERIQDERNVINEAFFVTLFRILAEEPQMTATEVLERAQEKGQLLGPAISNMQSELLGPQIEREIAILIDQGFLPPVPPVLLEAGGGEYEIEYVSPAARMQRAEEVVGVQRAVEVAAPFAALDPTVLQVFNAPEVIRHAADVLGVPGRLLRSAEEYEQIRQEVAQAQAQAAQLAAAQQMAAAGKDGAAAVSSLQQGGVPAAA